MGTSPSSDRWRTKWHYSKRISDLWMQTARLGLLPAVFPPIGMAWLAMGSRLRRREAKPHVDKQTKMTYPSTTLWNEIWHVTRWFTVCFASCIAIFVRTWKVSLKFGSALATSCWKMFTALPLAPTGCLDWDRALHRMPTSPVLHFSLRGTDWIQLEQFQSGESLANIGVRTRLKLKPRFLLTTDHSFSSLVKLILSEATLDTRDRNCFIDIVNHKPKHVLFNPWFPPLKYPASWLNQVLWGD